MYARDIIAGVMIVFKKTNKNMKTKWLKSRSPSDRVAESKLKLFIYNYFKRGIKTGIKKMKLETPVTAFRTINLLHYYYYMHCTKFIKKKTKWNY